MIYLVQGYLVCLNLMSRLFQDWYCLNSKCSLQVTVVGIPEVQEKNLQFIESSSEMSDPSENATKRVRRSNSTMSEGSDGRSPSPNAMAQMSSEHGEHNELDALGDSDEETSTANGSDRGDNRKMKVLAFQLKRSYIESPKYK